MFIFNTYRNTYINLFVYSIQRLVNKEKLRFCGKLSDERPNIRGDESPLLYIQSIYDETEIRITMVPLMIHLHLNTGR